MEENTPDNSLAETVHIPQQQNIVREIHPYQTDEEVRADQYDFRPVISRADETTVNPKVSSVPEPAVSSNVEILQEKSSPESPETTAEETAVKVSMPPKVSNTGTQTSSPNKKNGSSPQPAED